MHARVVVGVGKGVLFREVSSVQRCPYREVPLYFRFGVSESTVSRAIAKWIKAMDIRLSFLITWPDRESIQKTMPFCFRPHYRKVTSIIDCFELFIDSNDYCAGRMPRLVSRSQTLYSRGRRKRKAN